MSDDKRKAHEAYKIATPHNDGRTIVETTVACTWPSDDVSIKQHVSNRPLLPLHDTTFIGLTIEEARFVAVALLKAAAEAEELEKGWREHDDKFNAAVRGESK